MSSSNWSAAPMARRSRSPAARWKPARRSSPPTRRCSPTTASTWRRWPEAKGVPLKYEAAVAGGIPVIKGLSEGAAANRIERVYGLLNGTCNYILTRMEAERLDFASVLAEAQAAGYAEADPSFDIDGIDTAHKLSILAALAFGAAHRFRRRRHPRHPRARPRRHRPGGGARLPHQARRPCRNRRRHAVPARPPGAGAAVPPARGRRRCAQRRGGGGRFRRPPAVPGPRRRRRADRQRRRRRPDRHRARQRHPAVRHAGRQPCRAAPRRCRPPPAAATTSA